MTRARLVLHWNLRQMMAAHGLFQTSDLVPLLKERDVHLSRQYVHRLVTKAPQRVNIDLLAALCDILDCSPGDILQPGVEAADKTAASSGESGPGIGELRPVRARIRRPRGQG